MMKLLMCFLYQFLSRSEARDRPLLNNYDKFFWSSVSAAESNFVSVHSHMLTCKYIPDGMKQELTKLKALRREQTSRLKTGSQKAFFTRVWARLHGTPVPAPVVGIRQSASSSSAKAKGGTGKPTKRTHKGAIIIDAPSKKENGGDKPNPAAADGSLDSLNMCQSHDSNEIRAILESKSTLSSIDGSVILKHASTPGMNDALETEGICDDNGGGGGSTSGIDDSGGNILDSELKTGQSSESNEQASKSSLTSMALNLSAVSVHCKEEQRSSHVEMNEL